MLSKKVKRFLAATLAATMVLGSNVMVFATETEKTVESSGAIEYDNSSAIVFDQLTLPTVVENASANKTYDFTIDPTGMLKEYDSDKYETASVYFKSQKDPAELSATQLFTEVYAASADNNKTWTGIVKTASAGKIQELESDDFYTWVPKTDSNYTTGENGEYRQLTTTNIDTWFAVEGDNTTLKLKGDYKAEGEKTGTDKVCDGKIYKLSYSSATGGKIVDSATDPITNYVEIDTDGKTIKALGTKKLYSTSSGVQISNKEDLEYTPATVKYDGVSDTATLINKSTNKKTVTVSVTLKDITGLDIKSSSADFDGNGTQLAMAVVDQIGAEASSARPLTVANSSATTASVSFTVNLEPATLGETVYQKGVPLNDVTGGHNYAKFSGPNPTYTDHKFYIQAFANTGTDESSAKANWEAWAKTIDGNTHKKPSLSIVYKVENYTEAPSTYTVAFNSNGGSDVDSQDVTAGGKATEPSPAPTKAGKNFGGWYNEALTEAFDFNTEINAATTLYAKWDDPIALNNEWNNSLNGWYVSKDGTNGLDTTATSISSAEIDGVSILEQCSIDDDKWISVSFTGAALSQYNAGKKDVVFVVGGVTYTTTLE
jgi:uncharacterized repeat protein (TIGR02543 family)